MSLTRRASATTTARIPWAKRTLQCLLVIMLCQWTVAPEAAADKALARVAEGPEVSDIAETESRSSVTMGSTKGSTKGSTTGAADAADRDTDSPETAKSSPLATTTSAETAFETDDLADWLPQPWDGWIQPNRLASSLQLVATMTLLGLLPAILLMTTSYIRISIVLSVLRQAFGTQFLPLQVTTALAMFCTGLIMWPTWKLVHEQAVVPAIQGQNAIEWSHLWNDGIQPIRSFMIRQIDTNGNAEDVHLFLEHLTSSEQYPTSYDQVPLRALLPAYVLSELKTAFLIGFKVYLPFLVIDLLIATVTTSMGMFMLPPSMVSLPLKLLVFVMVDGWRLVIDMLLHSFQ